MKAIKIYVVSTKFSKREIQARNKKEAKELFKSQLKEYYSGEKIIVD